MLTRGRPRTARLGASLVGKFLLCVLTVVMLTVCAARATAGPAPEPDPVRLKPATLTAFEHYVQLTETRKDEELRRGEVFLWVDSLPQPQRAQAYAQLRQGQVRIERLETHDSGRPIPCPDGLIHHWVGVIFVTAATLEQTLRLVQDYDHHASYFAPDVMRSKILKHNGNDYHIYLRFLRKKAMITVVLDTEHEVHYFPIDATHVRSQSLTTRVAEVENHDRPDERQNSPRDFHLAGVVDRLARAFDTGMENTNRRTLSVVPEKCR